MFDTTLSHRGKKGMLALSLGFAACTPLVLTGCGGGGGDSSGGNAIVPLSNAKSVSIPQTGGDVALDKVNNVGYTVKFPANALAAVTTVTVTPIASANLPTSITKGVKGRAFTADPANTYLTAFKIDAGTVTKFNVPVTVGATGLTNYAAGTILNIALLTNNQWNDVGTLIVDASGNLSSQLTSYTLPGIVAPGTYVIYKQGTTTGTTTLANFGVALVADDQSGGPGMQVINLYDASGNVLPTPAIKTLAFSGASDLDGQAMTPDGKYGILVDGGNTIRFFSGVNTGVPLASANTLNISAYGGDGDSVAIMPNGDEAVVAGDSTQLLVVSGITTGTPAEADTIDAPGRRDGVVISNDGKVLLARGYSGLTVYSITPKTAAAGALGGQIAHTYTKTMDITTAGASGLEDGRDGMAISPTDSSRAVVVRSNGSATVELYTGLPNAPTRSAVTLTGAYNPLSVSVTPDGKNAIVGTSAGLVLLTGVDTGTLTQVGAPYAPTFTVPATGGGAGTSYTLSSVPSLAVTLDNKNVVVCAPQPSRSGGTLLVIPFTTAGFGPIAGQLNGVAIPSNDQILIH